MNRPSKLTTLAPARLSLGAMAALGLAMACVLPAGERARTGATGLLVLEAGRPSLSLLGTSEVRGRVTVAGGALHIAASPSGALGAISVPEEGRVQFVDVTHMRRAGDLELGIDQRPSGLAFIDEQRLLIGSANSGRIALYDSAYGRVTRVLESGGDSSTELAVDATQHTLWVLDTAAGRVARLGWTRPELRRSVYLGEALSSLALRPGSNEIWVLSSASDRIIILAKDTLQLLGEIPCASGPVAIAFDGNEDAWVACRDSDEVLRFDAQTGALRTRVALSPGPGGVGAHPVDILLEPERGRAWVVCPGAGSLQIIDLKIERCVAEVGGLQRPIRMLHAPSAGS